MHTLLLLAAITFPPPCFPNLSESFRSCVQGLVALCEALPLCSTLKLLLLWGNSFGPAACEALHGALASPSLAGLRMDVVTYVVDGEAKVALADEL
ncbi:MAG: hypothetical protein WDW36_009183 [Sanguina aurantia]